ncbi:PIN-like domain-containing protein [Microvirga mediterraneensis]|uniref:DUF4935 domain-containing protein n=1 Tax=Microvirga mediterraneensis TaxID=2754695 RepID=A0A838BHK1_9HYPH|nr:PIN domain-containing protein [Microvirga mediterraneensis]MBA1155018.1 DUF4935 domain-containing protein [Microvirga mediterraneensis]
MKSRFVGYYRPNDAEFKALWDQCLFVPDTNVLLHLFRYGENTRNQVFETFNAFKSRLWIPYQVGLEFHRRWREIDYKNRSAYKDLTDKLTTAGNSMKALFNDYNRHQLIDADAEKAAIDKFISERCRRLEELSNQHPNPDDALGILNRISDLIGDQVGERLTEKELEAIYKEGESRYKRKIPPGFRDASKQDADVYGDLVIWKAMLSKAKADQCPIIFVTDDLKDDWWHEFKGEKVGPRPELLEEFRWETGQSFYMYSLGSFIEQAGNYLNKVIDESAIKEIEEDESAQKASISLEKHLDDVLAQEDMNNNLRDFYLGIIAKNNPDIIWNDSYFSEAKDLKNFRWAWNEHLNNKQMLDTHRAALDNELLFLEHREAVLQSELAQWTPQKGKLSFDAIWKELNSIRQRISLIRHKK